MIGDIVMSNLYAMPGQINRHIKDVSLPLYKAKINKRLDEIDCIQHTIESQECCPICQDTISKGMIISKLSCGHKFHHHCILKLVMNDNCNCPICRNKIIEIASFDDLENLILYEPTKDFVDLHVQIKQLIAMNDSNTGKYVPIPFIKN